MDVSDQTNHLDRLLLGPISLLHHLFGATIPGGFFLLLLAFKGNLTVKSLWFDLPFGYRTNLAVALLSAYILGKLFLIPATLWQLKEPKVPIPENMNHLPKELRQAVFGAFAFGSLSAVHGLAERMAAQRAEVAFHLGLGTSLITASLFPGDGRFRLVELFAGILFEIAAIALSRYCKRQVLPNIGLGLANVLSRLTKDQITILGAVATTLQAKPAPIPQPSEIVEVKPESLEPTATHE
jgi:hypothetical protein